MRHWIPLALVLASGCAVSTSLDDPNFATGSSALVVGPDPSWVFGALPEAGVVSAVHRDTGEVQELTLVGEPTRIARVGDELFVTLRAARSVAVIDPESLTVVDTFATGAEPYGIVASEDGSRVYVAASQQGRVEEYNADSRSLRATWDIEGEPRWLALHPSGESLVVGTAFAGLALVHPRSDAVQVLPILDTASEEAGTVRRVTGDLSISPSGVSLVVPILDVQPGTGLAATGYYSGAGGSLLVGEFDRGYVPHPDAWQALAGVQAGVLSSALVTEFGTIYATDYGSEQVLRVELPSAADGVDRTESGVPFAAIDPEPGTPVGIGSAWTRAEAFTVGSGPRALVRSPGPRVFVLTEIDETIEQVDLECEPSGSDSCPSTLLHDAPLVTLHLLTLQERIGRRLFQSAVEPGMSSFGSKISCGTCHFEGRNDGLTWSLPTGDWQTPSLAGVVSQTTPLTWTSGVGSVGEEAMLTATNRMGGQGPNRYNQQAIAAYIDSIRVPDSALAGSNDDSVQRGRAIFESSEARCSDCHAGPQFTDRRSHAMYGLDAVDTPTLVGVSATAPYLHAGQEPTLRAVLENLSDEMGSTAHLDAGGLADLEAYLRSL